MEDKRPRIAKTILEKENNVGVLILPDSKNNMWLLSSKSNCILWLVNWHLNNFPKRTEGAALREACSFPRWLLSRVVLIWHDCWGEKIHVEYKLCNQDRNYFKYWIHHLLL